MIGAGAVGLEFASMYRSFGAEVTMVEALPRLAPLEDEELSKAVARAFRKRGITTAAGASRHLDRRDRHRGDGRRTRPTARATTVSADICLVAIGRGPVTEGLGVGRGRRRARPRRGYVQVDDQLRTTVARRLGGRRRRRRPRCSSRTSPSPKGCAVAERIAGIDVPPIDYHSIPRVTYSSPEIASVGLTEAQAREAGREIVVEKLDFRAIGKANIVGEGGFVKVVAEANDGPGARRPHDRPARHRPDRRGHADHRTWEASPSDVAAHIHPHPTLSEGVGEAHARARRQGPAHAVGGGRPWQTTVRSDATANDRPLPDERLRDMLYLLKLARYFDERMEALYRQGRLPGAIYSGRGQEGTHVGTVFALEPRDSLFPTHRDLTAQLTKGLDLNRVIAQFWGRIDGYLRGRDGNSHIGDW